MKFQIIIEATDKKRALMADDEFEKLVGRELKIKGFKLVGARSLEGIIPECWKPARKFPPAQPTPKEFQAQIDKLKMQIKQLHEQIPQTRKAVKVIARRRQYEADPLD